MKKQEYTGTTLDKTYDYLGSVQYLNGTSQFASTGEGRVYNNSGTFRYDYFMKDQVGNIRLTYTANGSSVNILQRDEYYPFGNTFGSYLGSGGANTYKFNGMEYQENGLNTIDFNARMYDPQIGRTFQPDPMADMYAFKSPYAFLANNPVMVTDPTGMMDEPAKDANEGEDFGAVAPVNAVSWGSWFMNIGLNYRGGNGFLAAFRGEGWGNRGTRQVHTTIDQMYTVVERYLDEYLDFPVVGFRSYKGTKFLGTYLVLNNALGSAGVSLLFNGSTLSLMVNGKTVFSAPAVSGRPLADGSFDYSVARQKMGSTGPIPEGNYTINPQATQWWTSQSIIQRTAAIFHKGTWPGGPIAWGVARTWITPDGANVYDRSGFTIHGGFEPGSAGCIDLHGRELDFFRTLQNYSNSNSIPLRVTY